MSSPVNFWGRSDTHSRGGVKAELNFGDPGLYPLALAREKYFYDFFSNGSPTK